MITFDGKIYLTFHITIPYRDDIDKICFKLYNCQ